MRAETTDGTYAIAEAIMRTTNCKPPLGFYQMGPSFRRETSDGATAAKLRSNAFVQLEFQLIHSADTKADIVTPVREALALLVRRATGSETRLIPSDRLPAYSTETVDIEVLQGNHEWREVASTSRFLPEFDRLGEEAIGDRIMARPTVGSNPDCRPARYVVQTVAFF
jgi:glycyl-tRNA synthetase